MTDKIKCPLCPKAYQSENDLRIHLKWTHDFDKDKAEKELDEWWNVRPVSIKQQIYDEWLRINTEAFG